LDDVAGNICPALSSGILGASGRMLTPIQTYDFEPATPLSQSIVPSPASVQNDPQFSKYESTRILTDPVDLNELAGYVAKLRWGPEASVVDC
jgi:hypothetical protein